MYADFLFGSNLKSKEKRCMEVLNKPSRTVSCPFCGENYVIPANDEDMKVVIGCPHCGKPYTVNFRTGRVLKRRVSDDDTESWPKLPCPHNRCNGYLRFRFVASGVIQIMCWKCGKPYIADLDTGETRQCKKTK